MKTRELKETKENFMQKTVVVWMGALLCCLLWGSAFPCVKIGYQMFEIPAGSIVTQILFAGCRFTLAGILIIVIGSALGRKVLHPKKESFGKVFKLCLLQTVIQYLLFYVGLAHTSGVKASIIEGLNVFVAIFVASIIYKQEKLTVRKILGSVVGFAGVALVTLNGNGMDLNLNFFGEGFIFFSTVAYAFSSVLLKRYSKDDNPVMLSGYQFLTGGLIMAVCGFLAGGRLTGFSLVSTTMLFYLACISAIAYTLWGILLKYNSISKVAVFGFMNPVFGVILSAWLLNEKEQATGVKSAIALVLICIGIYIVNRNKEKESAEA